MSGLTQLSDGALFATGRPYLERADDDPGWADQWARRLFDAVVEPLRSRWHQRRSAQQRFVALAGAHEADMRLVSDTGLQQRARDVGARLRRHGFGPALAAESFAIVREAAQRTLGQRHYDIQLLSGMALLEGRLVEMATGEGKTFAATLPACTVALAGYPVHVITVNDYLAARDAAKMGPLYRFLGLGVGTVVQGMQKPQRRAAYAESITYCTNKELAFDYLRDRVALQGGTSALHGSLQALGGEMASKMASDDAMVLRGLHFAIVDEADSIFVDEARTPLILSVSRGTGASGSEGNGALALARKLVETVDYRIDHFERRITLSSVGKETIEAVATHLDGVWSSVRAREELMVQALSALRLYQRDHHYVVTEGKVQIVDESTGRVMPDRSWERGLHQLIEVKEGCEPTAQRETLARLTYQRLFRRYVRLAGMTGTAREVAGEIASVYRLQMTCVALHRPSRRRYLGVEVLTTLDAKWARVAEVAERLSKGEGRAVLIGTRSVGASEALSDVLTRRRIEHTLLNAKQDCDEADVIAGAGAAGRVTVATNMAGRGTDISLGEGVARLGGLHVILTEYHESRRVDRQLFGRCARQGDPGSCQAIVSLEDEMFRVCAPRLTAWLNAAVGRGARLPGLLFVALRALAQRSAEARHAALRAQNLKHDQRLDKMLAFSGRGE